MAASRFRRRRSVAGVAAPQLTRRRDSPAWAPTVSPSMMPASRQRPAHGRRMISTSRRTTTCSAAGALDAQRVHALRIRPEGHGLSGGPLQQQPRGPAAHAGNIGGDFLLNINNPYLDADMREVLHQLDLPETGAEDHAAGSDRVHDDAERRTGGAHCGATFGGTALPAQRRRPQRLARRRGTQGRPRRCLGEFPPQPELRRVLHFRALGGLEPQEGAASRSRYAAALLASGCASAGGQYLRTEPFRSGRERHQDQCHQRDRSRTESGFGDARRRCLRAAGRSGRLLGRRRMAQVRSAVHPRRVPAFGRRGRLQPRPADGR